MEKQLKFFTAVYDSSVDEYLEKEIHKWQYGDARYTRSIEGVEIAIHNINCFCLVIFTEENRTTEQMTFMLRNMIKSNPKLSVEKLKEYNFPDYIIDTVRKEFE